MEDRLDTPTETKTRGPNKPTLALIAGFSRLIEEGLPPNVACDYLGVAPQTFLTWIRKGRSYNLDPDADPKHKIYGDFESALKKSLASWYLARVKSLHDPRNPHWKRELEILERRDKKNFGKYDLSGDTGTMEELDTDARFL